jgi:sec-independent protein translocase protein TatA
MAGAARTRLAAEDGLMGSLSIWHWIVVIGVGLLLFGGRGKISELMGDFAQGIKAFKKGMQDDDTAKSAAEPAKSIDHQPGTEVPEVKARSSNTV